MVRDVLNSIELFSMKRIGKYHNRSICLFLITVVAYTDLLQTVVDTIGYIPDSQFLFSDVKSELDMIAKNKNVCSENVQKQEESYSRHM
jgi:hypothetical protein